MLNFRKNLISGLAEMARVLAAYHPHDCPRNQLGFGPRIAMSLTASQRPPNSNNLQT